MPGRPAARSRIWHWLNGCRLAICAELDDGDRLRAGEIKALTGEQTFTARRLYAEYTTFKTTWNILLQTNVMPRCTDLSEGMGRRLRIVRFNYRVTEEERDPQLVKKILAAESSGVLNWMLAGSRDYLAVGLKQTAAMRRELEHYRADLDVVAEWVSACCEPITNDEYELCLKSRQRRKSFGLVGRRLFRIVLCRTASVTTKRLLPGTCGRRRGLSFALAARA